MKLFFKLLLANIVCIVFVFNTGKAQSAKIFLRSGVTQNNVTNNIVFKSFTNSNIGFSDMKFLYTTNIDPNNNGDINYNLVNSALVKLFPNSSSSGYLCVDLEDINYDVLKAAYSDMRPNSSSNQQIKIALNKFIELAKFIKKQRPNVKFGFYGVPFKVYNENNLREGGESMFNNLVVNVDILFPSLYIPYIPTSNNLNSINQFLNRNLSYSFNYSDKNKKQVIPLIWYFTLSNKRNQNNVMIPKDIMNHIINTINDFKSASGSMVSGIIWWEEAKPFYKKNLSNLNQNYIPIQDRQSVWTQQKAFNYYWKN